MPTDQSTSDTERPGELERFAVERALYAAWTTELWIPADPDYGFIDYFEAAATRNLSLLHGFEDLAEGVDRRGIVPQSDSDQAKLVTDGGQSTSDTDQRTDGEKLIDGLNAMIEDSTPDEEDWCPNCEKYAVFDVIQTVERPEFGVENDVKACPDCRYTAINQTEWRSIDPGSDRPVSQSENSTRNGRGDDS